MTASRFKSAVCTDLSQPSQLLIKAICYPDRYKFITQATKWWCEHEKTARNAYIAKSSNRHSNMSVSDVRLIIHPHFPHYGASPDGLVKCDCCGHS